MLGNSLLLFQRLFKLKDHNGGISQHRDLRSHCTAKIVQSDLAASKHCMSMYMPAGMSAPESKRKCYIVTTDVSVNISNDFQEIKNETVYVYKNYITGFSFCTGNEKLIQNLKSKNLLINIEEDHKFTLKIDLENIKTSGGLQTGTNRPSQPAVSMYMYRLFNLGNLILNNFFLDNCLLRLLRINKLIAKLYSYDRYYTGNNVRIVAIDVPSTSPSYISPSSVIINYGYTFSANASITLIPHVKLDGSIPLSELLYILDNIDAADILFLPVSGPHSDSVDVILKQMSKKMIVVVAGGASCNESPKGYSLLTIGSVDKFGAISRFSNCESCNNFYALGENVESSRGTAYSAASVASATAMYLEKYPSASLNSIKEFLLNNSVKNNDGKYILKPPVLNYGDEKKNEYSYYYHSAMLIYYPVCICILLALAYGLYKLFRLVKRKFWPGSGEAADADNSESETFSRSLRGASLRSRG